MAVLRPMLALREDVMPPRFADWFSLSTPEDAEAALLPNAVISVLACVGFRV